MLGPCQRKETALGKVAKNSIHDKENLETILTTRLVFLGESGCSVHSPAYLQSWPQVGAQASKDDGGAGLVLVRLERHELGQQLGQTDGLAWAGRHENGKESS